MAGSRRKSATKRNWFEKNILHNVFVLYTVFVLAIVNVLQFLMKNELRSLSVFFITALMIYFYNPNMIIVLVIAMIISNIYAMKRSYLKRVSLPVPYSSIEGMGNHTHNVKKKKVMPVVKEGVANRRIRPASIVDDDELENEHIDKAANIENAFSTFEDILGPDAMKKMTSETNELIKKQQELMDSMKGAGDLVNNMKGMMKDINMDDIKEMQSSLKQMIPNKK